MKLRYAVERSVIVPLLALMDVLRSDGSVDSSAVPATVELVVDGNYIQRSCEAVAAIVKARFATPSQICEQKYFTVWLTVVQDDDEGWESRESVLGSDEADEIQQ
ncbi:hypothetical protein GQ600_8805 [Phytophthora cactorum]|nr:hypothetical protein GQ600_8805 [Phytophthora cactorum]